MKPEQQRIAIAEACGYRNIALREDPDEGFDPLLTGFKNDNQFDEQIPDYLNSLNAMHEAEKMLRKPMKGSDTDTIIGDRMHKYAELIGYAFDSTAAQRAEAFLKTIGKWTTNQNEL